MLAPDGRLKGDLTVFNWGDGTWWIMGSYYLREWHMRWFHDHREEGVQVEDISDSVCGFSISGPKARALLSRLTHEDVGPTAMPFMGCREMDVGLVRAKVGRLSVTGELGYEIFCDPLEHLTIYRALKEAGTDLGAVDIGYGALLSLRLEKSFGIWNAEFMQAYTPGETGMDRWIDWEKPDFLGKQAALAERDSGPGRRLVTLEVHANGADASGFEPVWRDGARVGYITSGGYGHCVDRSLAMAFVPPDLAEPGTELTTHIVGAERAAQVIPPSPYDPAGTAMRG